MTENESTIFLVATNSFYQSFLSPDTHYSFQISLCFVLSYTLSSYHTLSTSHTLFSPLILSLNSADIDVASLNDQIEKIVSAIERMKKEDSSTPEEFSDPKDDQTLD